ncbi:MAG TPA: hypothetical protein VLX92_22655 [Kofleriaceae bacterium]|nr:hypothetical protein [Kofleriaceae bacterium]
MTYFRTRHVIGIALALGACGGNTTNKSAPDAPAAMPDASGPPNLTLTTQGSLGARLVDSQGKTLYFFANDIAGSNASTYSGAAWPVFDVQTPIVGEGLSASDFGRFDRGGGAFQTTWKGRPLYYYANDTSAAPTAGEGIGGRWFVARAYDLFFGANSTVTPQGSTAADAPFLTDGAGRTLYVYAADTRGVSGGAPTSACGTGCLAHWPLWPAPASLTGLALPSTVQAANLTSFTNTNASQSQFVYLGWPLYYYATDTSAGEVAGASIPSWYTASPGWNGTMTQ